MLSNKKASERKLKGAYYTPAEIASFILHWGISGKYEVDILEPSCGSGMFLERLRDENMSFKTVTAVEYEPSEATKARALGLHDSEVINDDFHRFCLDTTQRFDLIVGNPPFIRYQYYVPDQQVLADKIFSRVNLKRTKLTNAWVTFVVGCSQLLRENGKMGFVIPSELLMVSYAGQLRKYLAQTFNKINIISFENLVFADIQQDVVILLCEKDGTDKHFIEHIEIKDAKELAAIDLNRLNNPTKKFDFLADKWTYYFLSRNELDLLAKVKGQPTLSAYSNLEVGITTGNNDYFTVSDSAVTMNQLQDFARPMAGGSRQVASLCFTAADWWRNADAGEKAYLLTFTPDALQNGNAGVRAYIRSGEALGIDKGYKTSIRNKWWVVPSIKISDAFSLHRIHLYPKIVLNDAGVYVTSNLNRIFIKPKYRKKVDPVLLRHTMRSAAVQVTRKFVYAQVPGNYSASEVKKALDMLIKAGILIPVTHSNANGLPLGDDAEQSIRKMLLLDTGLMLRLLNMSMGDISEITRHILTSSAADLSNKGSVAEMLAGLEYLHYLNPNLKHELFYWVRQAKSSLAEIDYVIPFGSAYLPMEVKAGVQGGMKSLWEFMRDKKLTSAVRCSLENFGAFTYTDAKDADKERHVTICPLYALSQLSRLLQLNSK